MVNLFKGSKATGKTIGVHITWAVHTALEVGLSSSICYSHLWPLWVIFFFLLVTNILKPGFSHSLESLKGLLLLPVDLLQGHQQPGSEPQLSARTKQMVPNGWQSPELQGEFLRCTPIQTSGCIWVCNRQSTMIMEPWVRSYRNVPELGCWSRLEGKRFFQWAYQLPRLKKAESSRRESLV